MLTMPELCGELRVNQRMPGRSRSADINRDAQATRFDHIAAEMAAPRTPRTGDPAGGEAIVPSAAFWLAKPKRERARWAGDETIGYGEFRTIGDGGEGFAGGKVGDPASAGMRTRPEWKYGFRRMRERS
jgi:hypothetical protein